MGMVIRMRASALKQNIRRRSKTNLPEKSGRFFVSSDINPLRDLRYTAKRCDISSMRYALRGVGDLYRHRCPKATYRNSATQNYIEFAPGKYIEFCEAKYIDKKQSPSYRTDLVLYCKQEVRK